MVQKVINKYERTNIFIISKELWAWASYRAKTQNYNSTSEYIFDLIKQDKQKQKEQ